MAKRLIEAVGRFAYPADRLEIQVLDDSNDETRHIARAAVDRLVANGLDATYVHRNCREGFKAGALAHGLEVARGEFIAIFDADFVPESDFLARALAPFADPGVGMAQARWGHLNRGYSVLTHVQALILDAHFVLESGGRFRAGCFFNFNGTAGIWRRAAIETAGGWQHDNADGGSRPQLSRPARGLAVRLSVGSDRAGGAARRDEWLQGAAASVGERARSRRAASCYRESCGRSCPGGSRSNHFSIWPRTSTTSL